MRGVTIHGFKEAAGRLPMVPALVSAAPAGQGSMFADGTEPAEDALCVRRVPAVRLAAAPGTVVMRL